MKDESLDPKSMPSNSMMEDEKSDSASSNSDAELDARKVKEVEELGPYLIRHNNPKKMKWDLFVMLLAVWNCFSIPFEVAFDFEEPLTYVILNYICDISFVVDIVLSFRTTYLN